MLVSGVPVAHSEKQKQVNFSKYENINPLDGQNVRHKSHFEKLKQVNFRKYENVNFKMSDTTLILPVLDSG